MARRIAFGLLQGGGSCELQDFGGGAGAVRVRIYPRCAPGPLPRNCRPGGGGPGAGTAEGDERRPARRRAAIAPATFPARRDAGGMTRHGGRGSRGS